MTTQAPGTGATTPEAAPAQQQQTQTPPADRGDQGESFDAAKARRKIAQLEKEREQQAQQLAELEAKSKSEAERAMDEAYKKGKSETEKAYEERIKRQAIDHLIERTVVANGYPVDLAHIVRARGEFDSLEDVEAETKKILGTLDWAKPNGVQRGGQPGGPGQQPAPVGPYPRNGQWDREQIQELVENGEYSKYREAIEKAGREGQIAPWGIRVRHG